MQGKYVVVCQNGENVREIKYFLAVVSDLAEDLLPSLCSYQRAVPCCSIVLHH